MELSLLQNVSKSDVILDPFPHIVISQALPDELHQKLRAEFPVPSNLGINEKIENQRWSVSAIDLPKFHNLSTLWRRFINYHTSQEFWLDFQNVFEHSIVDNYRAHFPSRESLRRTQVESRNADRAESQILALDAQISGNTPTSTSGVPRGVHTDSPNALFAGLYYLRSEVDDSKGGDLQIWRWKSGYSQKKKSNIYKEDVPAKHIELVKTIPYQSNTLVILLNSLDSLHSVTERQPTVHGRQFVNLLADSNFPFFSLTPSRLRAFTRRYQDWKRSKI